MGVSFQAVHNRKNERNKSGLYTVNIRVTIDRVPKYLSIKQFPRIRPAEWNARKAIIKNNHPFHYELNEALTNVIKNLNGFYARYLKEGKPITHQNIKAFHERGTTNLNFIDFARDFLKGQSMNLSTKKHYHTLIDKMEAFRPGLYLSDFDRRFLEEFIDHLREGYANNTLRNRVFKLRKIYENACKQEEIRPDYFLFKDLGVKSEKAKRHPLSPEEIEKWVQFDASAFPMDDQKYKDVFSFQLRTGMYYSDILKSKRSTEIKKMNGVRYLDGSRFKNDNQFLIPLNLWPEAEQILDKWDNGSDELFPDLITDYHFNKKIRSIANMIGIVHPKLSNKIARHSFADYMISLGVERQFLSTMLGHTKEETTSEYYQMNINLLMKRIDKVSTNHHQ